MPSVTLSPAQLSETEEPDLSCRMKTNGRDSTLVACSYLAPPLETGGWAAVLSSRVTGLWEKIYEGRGRPCVCKKSVYPGTVERISRSVNPAPTL